MVVHLLKVSAISTRKNLWPCNHHIPLFRNGNTSMKKDDIITLSNGQKATIIRGDESYLTNSYVVQLEDGQLRMVDKKTLTLARAK